MHVVDCLRRPERDLSKHQVRQEEHTWLVGLDFARVNRWVHVKGVERRAKQGGSMTRGRRWPFVERVSMVLRRPNSCVMSSPARERE